MVKISCNFNDVSPKKFSICLNLLIQEIIQENYLSDNITNICNSLTFRRISIWNKLDNNTVNFISTSFFKSKPDKIDKSSSTKIVTSTIIFLT